MSNKRVFSMCGSVFDASHASFDFPYLNEARAVTLHNIDIFEVGEFDKLKDPDTHDIFKKFCKIHHFKKKKKLFLH
jgi:hypothetical protein